LGVDEIAKAIMRGKDRWIEFLRDIVNIDSGTEYKEGVDLVADIIAQRLKDLGFYVDRIKEERYGDHILACINRDATPRILLVGHMDTVYPKGTVKERPFSVKNSTAHGPGVLDMKGGIMVMLLALEALKDVGSRAYQDISICVFLNSDEELLSPSSSKIMDEEAKKADLAIVFEPARPGGGYVKSRWSVAWLRIVVQGITGHAGWKGGVSAIHELIHELSTILRNFEKRGRLLINVGVIRGGERPSIIAPRAEAELSLRAPTLEEIEEAISNIYNITSKTTHEGAKSSLEIINKWPPLLDNERNRNAFRYFQKAAGELGIKLISVDAMAGSDANHISQYTAVVDGAGAYGGHPHSPYEYIEIDKTFERAIICARAMEIFHEASKSRFN